MYDPSLLIQRVAHGWGVAPAVIYGPQRTRTVTEPRHVAMYLLYDHVRMTAVDIGRLLGRDHTTVLSGVKRGRGLWESDPRVRKRAQAALDEARLRGDAPRAHPSVHPPRSVDKAWSLIDSLRLRLPDDPEAKQMVSETLAWLNRCPLCGNRLERD